MKHDIKTTAKILGWTFLSMMLGMFFTHFTAIRDATLTAMPELAAYVVIMGMILGGAVIWWFGIRKFNPKVVEWVFIIGLAILCSKLVQLFWPDPSWTRFAVQWSVAWALAMIFKLYIINAQRSWQFVRKHEYPANFVMITALAMAGAVVGTGMNIALAFALLVSVAIYDAWAVWKSGTMVEMAMFFIKRKLVPGIAIPKKKEGHYAMLGGGDVFFIVMMGAAFFNMGPGASLIIMGGMFGSLTGLFVKSKPKAFYPAIPFLLAGALIGLAVVWLVILVGYEWVLK